MALPALSKTYHAHANVPLADTSTLALAYKAAFWALKALLTNQSGINGAQSGARSAQSVWTHAASCDGASVSTVTDLWGTAFDASKLVNNNSGSAHSWWRGTNGTHDILIDLNSSSNGVGRIGAAATGLFSAGSTTAGPTASADWYAGSTSNNSSSVTAAIFGDSALLGAKGFAHLVTNSADHSFQFHLSRAGAGIFSTFLAFQLTSSAADSYNRFLVLHNASSGRGAPTMAGAGTAAQTSGRVRNNTAMKTAGGLTSFVSAGTALAGTHARDALSGEHWIDPVTVRDLTSSHVAKRGIMADWYTVGNAPVGCQMDGTVQERLVIGDFLLPFPGVLPIF